MRATNEVGVVARPRVSDTAYVRKRRHVAGRVLEIFGKRSVVGRKEDGVGQLGSWDIFEPSVRFCVNEPTAVDTRSACAIIDKASDPIRPFARSCAVCNK